MGKLHLVLASALFFLAGVCRALPPLSATEKRQLEREARLVVDFTQNLHESGRLFRDLNNREILTAYMAGLDEECDYFLKDDIDFLLSRFNRSFRSVYLLKGDLQPAFEIFDIFAKRVEERSLWAERRLTRGFDFTEDQSTPAKSDGPAATAADADRRWEIKIKAEVLSEMLRGAPEPEATATVAKRHARYRRHVATMDSLAIRERFFDGLLQAFDPHSGYFSADSTKEFHLEMSGAVAGAGLELKKENGLCVVSDIKPGGPADLTTDLRPGDVIEAYSEPGATSIPTKGRRLREIVSGIRGKPGTKLTLAYRHPGETESRSCTIERAIVVSIEDRARGLLFKVPSSDGQTRSVGVIDLPGFYADEEESGQTSATKDVAELLTQMRASGLDALVIDLRDNGGGALTEAQALSGLFIPKGLIMLSRGIDGKVIEHYATESKDRYDGPLVILTSERSASASEIFSGAMKFHRRAAIVGSTATFGKGSVQNYIELAKTRSAQPGDERTWGTLRLTYQRYYQPDGRAVQCDGIPADIVLPQRKVSGFQREVELPHALPADKVPPTAASIPCPALPNPVTTELIARLKTLAQENIAHLPEWSLWQREQQLIETLDETTSQSLLLEKRRAAQEATEATLATLRDDHRKLSGELDYPAGNIEIAAVQQALDAHRAHLLQPDASGKTPPLHELVNGGILFKTEQGKTRRLWLDQFDYTRFTGNVEPLATAYSAASATPLDAGRMREILRHIARLENVDEPAVIAIFSKHLPAGTEPATIRKGIGAMLFAMTDIEGDLRRHHRALDVQLREALRLAAAWSASPSSSTTKTP